MGGQAGMGGQAVLRRRSVVCWQRLSVRGVWGVRCIGASGQQDVRAASDDAEAAPDRSGDVVAGEPHSGEVGSREDIVHPPNVVVTHGFGNPHCEAVDAERLSGEPVTHRSPQAANRWLFAARVLGSPLWATAIRARGRRTALAHPNGAGSPEPRQRRSPPAQWMPGITGRIDSIVRDPSAACASTASSDPMDCSSVSSARVGRMSR